MPDVEAVQPKVTAKDIDSATSLFQLIKELNKVRQKTVKDIRDYPWHLTISELPNDSDNITVRFCDRKETDEDEGQENDILLAVHKPDFVAVPKPDNEFVLWLEKGWDDPWTEVAVVPAMRTGTETVKAAEGQTATSSVVEKFEDNADRVLSYTNWLDKRNEWAAQRRNAERTEKVFSELYEKYNELKREGESEEIIVANGILKDTASPTLNHPILTRRVKLEYDADENTLLIRDTDTSSSLYSDLFQEIEGIDLGFVSEIRTELQQNDYHPLDRIEAVEFLEKLTHLLSSHSIFSSNGVPTGWERSNRFLVYLDPCFILRKRVNGIANAIDQIVADIVERQDIPAPIRDIVGGGTIDVPEDTGEESIEEQLAAVGGESVDILLSKEANREQLEIARRIEHYNAVLVQGPPGTGKTHTIANLMGHFLAQGKSVLVTSQTTKALNVLKEKVAPGLQDLCVAVLGDSSDMEKSVDGITNRMSKLTSARLKREMDLLAAERSNVIYQLAEVRRKIFAILNQECDSIVYNGEGISPAKAAEFVQANENSLSYIPGKVLKGASLPLTVQQLEELYQSNSQLSFEEEKELDVDLPNVGQLMTPEDFREKWLSLQHIKEELHQIAALNDWTLISKDGFREITVLGKFGKFAIGSVNQEKIQSLAKVAETVAEPEDWMKYAIVDGKNGGAYRDRWELLIEQIQKTCACSEKVAAEQFGKDVAFVEGIDRAALKTSLDELRNIFATKGKIPKLTLMFHKEYAETLESVSVNGKQISSVQDCDAVLRELELTDLREKCAAYWDDLIAEHGNIKFGELDKNAPELVAQKWIPAIKRYLDWDKIEYHFFEAELQSLGIPLDAVFPIKLLDSDIEATDKKIFAITHTIPQLCRMYDLQYDAEACSIKFEQNKELVKAAWRNGSRICGSLCRALDTGDVAEYSTAYEKLKDAVQKQGTKRRRNELLETLSSAAPEWANAIRNREGIHGQPNVPNSIEDAWKWKQLSMRVNELYTQPFDELQKRSLQLSKKYREVTAKYAEKSGWYHLISRTEKDLDMRQALQGWKQTVKRIGKGTGKSAPKLRAEARRLMVKCQNAVPGWIMPIGQALESLNPKENHFDIVIVDEASQSDISSLAILYMGRKLIIVGDDEQVSPMAIGDESDQMDALVQMYIKDKIPNAHLYNTKTSIYAIATTTFQPLVLTEHFRCVPEIIGFSNMLSYNGKIKPLRDASSSNLLPAVVNYRVEDGERDDNKTNLKEAEAIVALIKTCTEQPEYANKTFGVISLLGNEQVKVLQRLIEKKISLKEIEKRRILCGSSANFQGDERDVIFLSLVDSNNGTGPLRLQGFGPDDAIKKRYNVAASRARDQLWVVDSLDSANDLKQGDIRKTLIDYSLNPEAIEVQHKEIEQNSESPFEEGVAKALADRGYHLVQQWKVGAYRLDMVVIYQNSKAVIECDGERWHSGEAKIREDMERQTILERLGWRFIRIRGSEYFRNPEKTIGSVIQDLSALGIKPEAVNSVAAAESRNTELLQRIKNRAAVLMGHKEVISDEPDMQTIGVALNPKEISELSAPVALSKVKEAPLQKHKQMQVEKVNAAQLTMEEVAEAGVLKEISKKTSIQNPKPHKEPQVEVSPSNRKRKANKPEVTVKPLKLTQRTEAIKDPPTKGDLISLIEKNHIQYVDKRSRNGALWIIGGHELDDFVKEARKMGVYFKLKLDGGTATKGKTAWWAK